MDGRQFDALVKRLATTRLTRLQALRGVAASAAALAGVRLAPVSTEAAKQCRSVGQTCEGSNPNCCPGTVCSVAQNPTVCVTCGAATQPCCAGFTCSEGLVCQNDVCVAGGAGGGGGGAGSACTSNANCPAAAPFCDLASGFCFSIGLSCKTGETPEACCRRTVKKSCARKQTSKHAKQNCLKRGKKRCTNLLRGITS
jgi:hypothetical protein